MALSGEPSASHVEGEALLERQLTGLTNANLPVWENSCEGLGETTCTSSNCEGQTRDGVPIWTLGFQTEGFLREA